MYIVLNEKMAGQAGRVGTWFYREKGASATSREGTNDDTKAMFYDFCRHMQG